MNKQEAVEFLFTIANELKRSFETPVILLTMKDYSDCIFTSLMDMRSALLHQATPARVADIISQFHLEWLQAVRDVDAFKRRIRETPHEQISRAIDFTVDCVIKRHNYFQTYINQLVTTMTAEENKLMQDNFEIMSGMHENLFAVLREKQKCLYTVSDATEYFHRVLDESEELLNWLDTLNDNLAIQYSKVVGFKFPELTMDLSKTLQQIIDEVSTSTDPDTKRMAKELKDKSKTLTSLVRLDHGTEVDIRKIIEKMKHLEDRIDRLKGENSSAVMALQHKTIFLEERLLSLENLKTSLYCLKHKNKYADHNRVHIFDHLLPAHERCRLVEELIKLWTDAICGIQDSKSIISILSVAEIREIFSDDLGKFTVDNYGRKLYKGDNGSTFQLNEFGELVPVKDDEKHVYFYDDCGRYYVDERKKRIYKAYDNASEYYINRDGLMLKYKEYRDGKEYWYDNLGCYFLDECGKRCYWDRHNDEYFENDGLGNLVRIRSENSLPYVVCPPEPVTTEESKYLQQAVGVALRKCLADVVLRQPQDPILYLSNCLIKYQQNMEAHQQRLAEEGEMMLERERRMREDYVYRASTAPASYVCEEEEMAYADPNFVNYQTPNNE